jgi:hypothetical protein
MKLVRYLLGPRRRSGAAVAVLLLTMGAGIAAAADGPASTAAQSTSVALCAFCWDASL